MKIHLTLRLLMLKLQSNLHFVFTFQLDMEKVFHTITW